MVTPVRQERGAVLAVLVQRPAAQVSAEGSRVVTLSDQCFDEAPSCTGKRDGTRGAVHVLTRGRRLEHTGAGAVGGRARRQRRLGRVRAERDGAVQRASERPGLRLVLRCQCRRGPEAVGPLSETRTWEEIHSGAQSVATADLSHIVFWNEVAEGLWPSLLGHGLALYEYAGRNQEKPFLVDVEGGEHSTKALGRVLDAGRAPRTGCGVGNVVVG